MRIWKNLKKGDEVTYRGLGWKLARRCRVSEVHKKSVVVRAVDNNSPFWLDNDTKHEFSRGWV